MSGQSVATLNWTNRPPSQALENWAPVPADGLSTLGNMPLPPRSHFLKAFCGRVRAARLGAGLTQAEVAEALRVDKWTYSKYEKRTPLPHHLIEPFAATTGSDIVYLLTGRRPRQCSDEQSPVSEPAEAIGAG